MNGIPHKAWLQKSPKTTTSLGGWRISTRKVRAVMIAGQVIEGASYSSFTPGQTTTLGQKIHTIFLNGYTDEMVEQLRRHAGGDTFYIVVSLDSKEPVGAITPKEYAEMSQLDDTSLDSATLQA